MRKPLLINLIALFAASLTCAGTFYQKGNYLYFEGEGKAPAVQTSQTQKRSMAREAAIMVAKAKIIFYIDDLRLKKTNESVKEAKTKDEKIVKKIEMLLSGVEVVRENWDMEDGCRVTSRIHKKSLLKQLQAQIK